jgi:TPR repeat protein
LIDYSLAIFPEQLKNAIKALKSLSFDFDNLMDFIRDGAFIDEAAEIKVLEDNVNAGLAAFFGEISYDGMTEGNAASLKELKKICVDKKNEARRSLSRILEAGDEIAADDPELFLSLASSSALCSVYGFGSEKSLDSAKRVMGSESVGEALERCACEMRSYVSGLRYYIDSLIAAEENERIPSAKEYGIKNDNPWRLIAKHESMRTSEKISLQDVKWEAAKALGSKRPRCFDSHTWKRLRFIEAFEAFRFDCEWSEEVALGLCTGIKSDADLSVWAMMKLGRRMEYSKAFKIASLLGYKGMSALISYLDVHGDPISDIKFDKFVASQRDTVCAYQYAEYIFNEGRIEPAFEWMRKYAQEGYKPAQIFLAHMLKDHGGSQEEALFWLAKHAENDAHSKLELFLELKDDIKQYKKAEQLALELYQIHGKVAYWLGQYYFSLAKYKESFNALVVGDELNDSSSALLLAYCCMHGYGTKVDLKKSYALLSAAEVNDSDAALPRLFSLACGLGVKVNPRQIKAKLNTLKALFEDQEPETGYLTDALVSIQMLEKTGAHKRFWNKIWRHQKSSAGVTTVNIAGQMPCFRPFIEFCAAEIAAKWSGKGGAALRQAESNLIAAASHGSRLARILSDFMQSNEEEASRMNAPKIRNRIAMAFSPFRGKARLSDVLSRIESAMNDSLLPKLCDLYTESSEEFHSLKMVVPWMDEVCKTLEGMRLYRESSAEMDSERPDFIKGRDALIRSAEAGDGRAAMDIFSSLPEKDEKETLFYLDIALACNISQAFISNAILIEDGARKRGSAFGMYLKAVYKGSAHAYSNMKMLRLDPLKKLRMLLAKRLAESMDLEDADTMDLRKADFLDIKKAESMKLKQAEELRIPETADSQALQLPEEEGAFLIGAVKLKDGE